jgi:UDPglucose 6-dehydrogenase
MIKLFRNNFLSVKVSFCNEIYDYCKMKEIDYEKVVEIAATDDRIGLSHTQVPGPDGQRGYGGTCFTKDISNTIFDMKENDMKSYILESSFNRNKEIDRRDNL